MARLSTVKPRIKDAEIRTALPPAKQVDEFYLTPQWKRLRAAALKRDGGMCVAPGCRRKAVVVDHIISRRNGGRDILDNLRSLCRVHDNEVKELPGGERRNGGEFVT